MKTEIDIKKLKPHPHNPRVISATELQKLVESLRGFPEMLEVRPLIINEGLEILGGNMRHRAAIILLEEGDERFSTIPYQVVKWSLEKQKEFMLKDNIEYGEWDLEALANDPFFAEVLSGSRGVELPNRVQVQLKQPQGVQTGKPAEPEPDNMAVLTFKFDRQVANKAMRSLADIDDEMGEALCKVVGI